MFPDDYIVRLRIKNKFIDFFKVFDTELYGLVRLKRACSVVDSSLTLKIELNCKLEDPKFVFLFHLIFMRYGRHKK